MQFIAHDDAGWTGRSDLDTPHPTDGLVLTLAQWQAVRATWPATLRTGVRLTNTDDVATLVPDLQRLDLVLLSFPKWTDGRAYSQARLLRARHRYGGELRAEGDVVVDMAPLLARTGFSSARLRPGQDLAVARRALRIVPAFYQGDTLQPQPIFHRQAA